MSKILPGTKTTRMELLALKNRMKLAERGHNLLREKRDSLIMEFFNIISEIKDARENVTYHFNSKFKDFGRSLGFY